MYNFRSSKKRKKTQKKGVGNLQKQKFVLLLYRNQKHGVVVQLVRMPACHAGGREFESRPYRNKERKSFDFRFLFMVGCDIELATSEVPLSQRGI